MKHTQPLLYHQDSNLVLYQYLSSCLVFADFMCMDPTRILHIPSGLLFTRLPGPTCNHTPDDEVDRQIWGW